MPEPEPSTTVAVKPTTVIALHEWDDKYRELVKRTVLKPKKREATNVELALFAEQVQRTQLNPFIGQIYAIYRWDSRAGDEVMQVQVGIDGFRIVAERTGKYLGQTKQEWCDKDGNWRDAWLSDKHPSAARVGVYKAGRREATYAVAHWAEYVQDKGLWKSMPANQIAKCAEALALRKAFPAELSGLYTPEEAARRATEGDLTDIEGSAEDAAEIALPPAVEQVIARATDLGYAPLANRAAVAMAVGEQPEEFVAQWVASRTQDLNRYVASKVGPEAEITDAEVVHPTVVLEGAAAERAAEILDRREAEHAADTQSQPSPAQQPIDAVIAEGDAASLVEAWRKRANELLDEATVLDESGDERAAEVRQEAEALMDKVDAAQPQPPEQGSLGL